MSATGSGACGPGPGPASGTGSGASNPRKFSEKIALHTQRQAEETAAFQEVMMDITSTRLQAQNLRLARSQGPYYSGSLPNVNQIGRSALDFQASFPSTLESSRSTRHHGLVERVQRDRRFLSPGRPYRSRHVDSSPYSSAYLSPPPDPSWRRNWSGNFPMDKSPLFRLPTTALNRTNSDSALHTSVMKPPPGDPFSSAASTLRPGQTDGENRRMFPYPVPPIEENVLDEGNLLKPWDVKKLSLLSSRPKSCEVPGINVFASPEQASMPAHGVPPALNTGGSLPDLSSLHFPSPLPTPLDQDEPACPGSLSGGSSTGNLTSTLTHLGITAGAGGFQPHPQGLLMSLHDSLANHCLQSSLSNPNLQSSLGSPSFSGSLSSASLQSSLSNPSLQSSLSSSPSLPSSLSSQSLPSSLSSSSLQSASGANPGYGGGASSASSYPPALSTSPRRRSQLSPLILPMGGDSRRLHSKQFSPTISPTLSSITQGVPLDTTHPQQQQQQQRRPPPHQQHLHLHNLHNTYHQQLHHFGPLAPHERPAAPQASTRVKGEGLGSCVQSSRASEEAELQSVDALQQTNHHPSNHHHHHHPGNHHHHPGNHHLSGDLLNDVVFNSLLEDPYLSLKSAPQFMADPHGDGLTHGGLAEDQNRVPASTQGSLDLQGAEQQLLHGYGGEARQSVPNIILTGESPPGLSKEIANALSHVPGFEMDTFSLDESLRMDPLTLDMLDGDLMLADPAVEDSFRSDRFQ